MESPQTPVQKRMTDLLMLTDAPWLATIIMGVSQPFAQLRDTMGLPPYFPLIVALVASTLIASYWVMVEQRTRAIHSLLLLPVVTMFLFSASIGANNVVTAAASGPTEPPKVEDTHTLQQENELLHKELEIEKEKTAILTGAAGGADTSWNEEPNAGAADALAGLFDWFSARAFAQAQPESAGGQLTAEQRAKLAELEREQRRIEATRRALGQKEQDGQEKPRSLWKSF